MNIDNLIDQHTDPYARAKAIEATLTAYVNRGGSHRTAQQAINDTLGMRAAEAREDGDDTFADNILTTLLTVNEWMVARAARKWGYDEDVENAARMGLWQACQRFQPGRGSFVVYATQYVLDAVNTAMVQSSYFTSYERRWQPAVTVATEDIQREGLTPTPDLIADRTGLPVALITRLLTPLTTISGSTPTYTDDDGSDPLIDTLPSDHDVEAAVIQADLTATMLNALTALTPTQAHVITRRYGLDGQPSEYLTEIAARTGWTKSAVSTAHATALTALKDILDPTLLEAA